MCVCVSDGETTTNVRYTVVKLCCNAWTSRVSSHECSVKSEVWSVECEVWSVKKAVRSEKCEVWSVKCEVWSLKSAVWSEVWSAKWAVWSVKCGVWSVKCGVWRVQWEVWSAKWSFKCDMWNRTALSQNARTHGPGWRTVHASSIGEKGLIVSYSISLPPRLVRVLLVYIYIIWLNNIKYVFCIWMYLGFKHNMCLRGDILSLFDSCFFCWTRLFLGASVLPL